MSDAPERIWATEDRENYGEDRFHTTRPMRGLTEYIRADLSDALPALADQADEARTRVEKAEVERDDWRREALKAMRFRHSYEAERDALRAALDDARGLLVDAMVQLTDGKIKTRRNRALLIQDFLSRDKEQPE